MAGNKRPRSGLPKVRRKRLARLASETRDRATPTPRNAVLRPLVDGLAPLLRIALFTPDGDGNFRTPAEVIDELCVLLHARIVGNSFRQVKANLSEDYSDDFRSGFPQDNAMPSDTPKPEAIEAGKRLTATREALGIKTIRRFAQLTDIDESLLTKYESGVVMIPARTVKKLKDVYGITHDWIFDGDRSKLPHDLVLKLLEQEKA